MRRYRVEFSSKLIDESRLRDVLEREFELSGIGIVREESADSQQISSHPTLPRNELEVGILESLSDGKPWRRKAIIAKFLPLASSSKIHLTLVGMARAGLINKPRHGVFTSRDAPVPDAADIPELMKAGGSPSHSKAFALLSEPRSAPALREELGVSRQRVDQLLKPLMKRGVVRRFEVAGERGAYVYVRADCFKKETLLTRVPELHGSRGRLLSALPPETLCHVSAVGLLINCVAGPLLDYLEQLSAKGLIVTFKMGQWRYVGITPRGLQHPQYDRNAVKASAADIVKDFGEARVRFVQMLQVLDSARTIDLTLALPEDYFGGQASKSGQIVQRLEISNLIEEIADNEKGKQPFYRLSDKGHFVAGILSRVRQPESAAVLRKIIVGRRAAYVERLRAVRTAVQETQLGAASPTQAAIVRALREHGRLSTTEIISKMDISFKNPRSIHLSLRSLAQRGVVRLVGVQAATNLWEAEA
jgi:DNA-binding transcriptional ArsR family regulator